MYACIAGQISISRPHPLQSVSTGPDYVVHITWLRTRPLQVATGEMTRVLSAPVGAETTGGAVYKHRGMTYYWANMQHPYEAMSAAATSSPGP
jgi:hypothetical protein